MDRRRFLVGGVAGAAFVAGCVSGGPGSGDSTTENGDRPTGRATTAGSTTGPRPTGETPSRTKTPAERPTKPGEIQRRVSLASADEVPAKYRVSIDVKLLESTVTANHTARIRVTTTNEGPKRKLSIGEDGCSLFHQDLGLSEKSGLILKSPGSAKWIDRKGDEWVPDWPRSRPRTYAAYGCGDRLYPTGDSVASEYLVWSDYQAAGYMTPGTYRFAEQVRIKRPDEGITTEPTAEFTWGFSLTVEKP